MNAQTENFDLERLVAILRRRWWVIALLTVLAGVSSYVFSELQTKKYTATASVLFQSQQLNQQAAGLQSSASPSATQAPQIMETNIQLLTQQAGVSTATARIVGHGLTPGGVSHAIAVSQQGQTNIASVSATTTNPSTAAAIANTFAAQFIVRQQTQQQAAIRQGLALVEHQIGALSRQQRFGPSGQALIDRAESLRILETLQNGGATVVKQAKPPRTPSSPRVRRNTALGFLFGLLLGILVAFLLERFDRRIRDTTELAAAYQLPLLASVPQNTDYALPPQLNSNGHRANTEVFKLLRAYLRYFNVDRELRVLLVASAMPGDGKTTVARNLAEAAQEAGTRTLLLETDLRRPRLATHYGLAPAPGLAELLIGGVDRGDAIRSVPIAAGADGRAADLTLDVLVAGHPPPNPAELLESRTMGDFLSWAAEHYGLVIVDTPPLAVVSDAMPLLGRVDGVVLVSELGKNTRDEAESLRERLVAMNAPLLGVVANQVKTKGRDGYGYGYGYGEYRSEGHVARTEPEPTLTQK